jgi:hypothetical protein
MCAKADSVGNGGEDEFNVVGVRAMSHFSLPSVGLESTSERRLDPDKRN